MKETETKQMNIQISNPTLDDWEGIKNLRLEALKTDPQAFGSSYEKELQQPDEQWKNGIEKTLGENPQELLLIAKDGDQYIGMIGAFPKNENTWNIKAVYVTPNYRSKGVSKKLVAEMLSRIDSMENIQEVILSVNVMGEAAIKLYKNFGFEVFDTIKGVTFGDGQTYDKHEMVYRKLKNKL